MGEAPGRFEHLERVARGGRVANTPFLEPDEAAALAARLRGAGVGVHLEGGYPGARRRVLTAFPDHIPEASTPLVALYYGAAADEGELLAALTGAGAARESLGDVLEHQDGLTVVALASAKEALLGVEAVAGRPVSVQEVGLERLSRGKRRRQQVIVPSLRVDALGAKAFGVSRAYFSKGVASGRVSVGGKRAGKANSAEPGDEVYAEGLGRFTVTQVQGETKKGNLKVELEVERG